MSELDRLANQHILESESHLRHIDEMMAKAREPKARQKLNADAASTLGRLEQEHGRAAQELKALLSRPKPATADTVAQSEGVMGVLQKIGLELERTLAAVGDQRGL
jgi:2-hydroxychromene-2-carboxylate isomerase